MQKTDWYPGDVDPLRVGMYECRREWYEDGKIIMLSFNGNGGWTYVEKEGVSKAGWHAQMNYHGCYWRGLTEPHHGS